MTTERTIIRNLKDIQNELWEDRTHLDTIEQYDKIIEYINTLDPYYYSLLVEGIKETMTIVFNNEIGNKLKENATSVERMRIFINHTTEDEIYQLDGYGNLKNIRTDDLDTLLLDLIKVVEGEE